MFFQLIYLYYYFQMEFKKTANILYINIILQYIHLTLNTLGYFYFVVEFTINETWEM